MRRIYPLKSLTFTSGGRGLIELDMLPRGSYLKGVLFNLGLSLLQSGSPAAILPATFNRVIDSLKQGRRINTTGQGLNVLNWIMNGEDPSATAYVPAGAGTFSRVVNLFLPFSDFGSFEADDTSPAVEVLKDTPLEIGMGSEATLFPSITTVTKDTSLNVLAVLETNGKPGKVATPVLYDYVDVNPDSRIDPGVYTHIALAKEDGSAITSAEVTGLTVTIDGTPVLDNVTVHQAAALFNVLKARSGAVGSYGTTTPYPTVPGEAVTEQPGGAAAAGAGVSVEFLPVLYPALRGKLTKSAVAPSGIRIRWTGTATSLRCFTRRVEPTADANVAKAAAKAGVPASRLTVKTASKAPVPAGSIAAAILPKQVE